MKENLGLSGGEESDEKQVKNMTFNIFKHDRFWNNMQELIFPLIQPNMLRLRIG